MQHDLSYPLHAPFCMQRDLRYPLAYVPAEGSGLAGGQLTLVEKAKNLVHHLKVIEG